MDYSSEPLTNEQGTGNGDFQLSRRIEITYGKGPEVTFKEIPVTGWQTKNSDRFILKWIKCNLSARITPLLLGVVWLRPWMITVTGVFLGMLAGVAFAVGWGVLAGLVAGISQVLDGVDGQYARLTGTQSPAGAFLDSVLDRYSDGFLVIGLIVYHLNTGFSAWLLFLLGALALVGSGLISYTSARGESLGIDLGEPTLASKGTRTTAIALSGLLSGLLPYMPTIALCYLVVHCNWVVFRRIRMAMTSALRANPTGEQ
jgi:phosphatidylglycerophosphate synthase